MCLGASPYYSYPMVLVLRPKTRVIPETLVCRILMFMLPFLPLLVSIRFGMHLRAQFVGTSKALAAMVLANLRSFATTGAGVYGSVRRMVTQL